MKSIQDREDYWCNVLSVGQVRYFKERKKVWYD